MLQPECFKRRISLVATWDQSGAPEHHPKWWKSAKISQSKFKVWSNMAIVIGKWSFGFFLKTLRHWSLRAPHFWRWACGFAWKRNGGLTRINRCVSSTKAHDRGFSRARNTSRPTFKSNCKKYRLWVKWLAQDYTEMTNMCDMSHSREPALSRYPRVPAHRDTMISAVVMGTNLLRRIHRWINQTWDLHQQKYNMSVGGIVYNRKMEIQPINLWRFNLL